MVLATAGAYHQKSQIYRTILHIKSEKYRPDLALTLSLYLYGGLLLILHIKYWSNYLYGRNLCLTWFTAPHINTQNNFTLDLFHHKMVISMLSFDVCIFSAMLSCMLDLYIYSSIPSWYKYTLPLSPHSLHLSCSGGNNHNNRV